MQFSQKGIDLLKKLEGFRPFPYRDQAGYSTIGYGTRIAQNKDGTFTIPSVTEESATQLLLEKATPVIAGINHVVIVSLNQNQFDALVCFAYNVGENAFNTSTLLRLLNLGDYIGAANQFDRWVFDGGKESEGLKNRRAAEKQLFLEI